MFQLQKHICKVDNFNPRAEKHGDSNVSAGDIRITTRAHSSVLDHFGPSYRPFLFRKPDVPGDQQPLIEGDTMTALDKPNLKPMQLDEDFPGYVLEIGTGLGIKKPMRLEEVELSNFKIEAMEGGSVTLSFTATCHPDKDQAGALCASIQNTYEVTLIPPATDDKQADLDV